MSLLKKSIKSASGIASVALTLLLAPAIQAGPIGVNGYISVAGSVPYLGYNLGGPVTFSQRTNAPGDGPLAFSDTVSGSAAGYWDGEATTPASASGTLSALVAGNQVSLSGDVAGVPYGLATGSGQLTAYDTLTFQQGGTYELTEIVSGTVDFQSCDGHQAIDAGVSIGGIAGLADVGFGCQNTFIGSGTQEFQTVFTIGAYTPLNDTLDITANVWLDDYPNESAAASITVTAYVDALSGSYTSASGTDYSTPSGTPEPATWILFAAGAMVTMTAKRTSSSMRQS